MASELVGLVPAAGHATRLQPLIGSKEALVVSGAPLITFLIDRMRIAGCSRIRVTTRAEKTDVVELARREGAEVVIAQTDSVSQSLLAALPGLSDDAIALVGFPDTIWEPTDGFRPLVDRVLAGADLAVGLFRVGEPERCDVVELSTSGSIKGITIKPEHPATNVTWGILAARVCLLHGLAGWDEPGRFLDELTRTRNVPAVLLAGPYEDAGTPEALDRLSAAHSYDATGRRNRRGMDT